MPFPTTPILDDFSVGASQALTSRAGWGPTTFFVGETTLTTDSAPTYAAGASGGTYYSNYLTALTGNDCETWITLGAAWSDFYLYARVNASGNGYYFSYNGISSLAVQKLTGFVAGGAIASYGGVLSAGDSVGIQCAGKNIRCWWRPAAGGPWLLLIDAIDTTYPGDGPASHYTALEGQGGWQVDAIGGGDMPLGLGYGAVIAGRAQGILG